MQHLERAYVGPVEYDGEFVPQRNVEVALRVLKFLGGFRDLDQQYHFSTGDGNASGCEGWEINGHGRPGTEKC